MATPKCSFRFVYQVYDLRIVVKHGTYGDLFHCEGHPKIIARTGKDTVMFESLTWAFSGEYMLRGKDPKDIVLKHTDQRKYVIKRKDFTVSYDQCHVPINNEDEYRFYLDLAR